MNLLKNLPLSQKLYGLVAFFVIALVLVGVMGITQMRSVSEEQRRMYANTVVPLRQVVDAGRQAAVHFRRMYPYILKDDPKSRKETIDLNENSEADVLKAIAFLSERAPTAEIKETGAKLADKWKQYKGSVGTLYAAAAAGNPDAAMDELKTHTDGLHVEVRNLMIQAGKLQESVAKEDTERVAATVDRTAKNITILIGLCILIGVGFGLALIRFVKGQLGGDPAQAVETAKRIAGGNLSNQVVLKPSDSTSLLFQLEKMRFDLSAIFKSVRQSAETVAVASNEISSGTNNLSERTEQQASALEETAASMAQLGTSASQNAESAKAARQLASTASALTVKAGDMVSEVVKTMKGINDSSTQIANIIGVIDSIAFQTNILALNAAVEAARAGEQGRGFAVVASEVRSLAQRSAEAAKEIKTLIKASTDSVAEGAHVVDRTGGTMAELVDSIREVSDIVGEISTASSQQSTGVRQVGEAITQMDETTQQNAALVEESAAAVESLKDQAAQLVAAVSVFRINAS